VQAWGIATKPLKENPQVGGFHARSIAMKHNDSLISTIHDFFTNQEQPRRCGGAA